MSMTIFSVLRAINLTVLVVGCTLISTSAPTITSISPADAIVNTIITITGTELGAATAVTLNGIAVKTINENTDTTLKVTIPLGATTGKVSVTTAFGTVISKDDLYILFGEKINPKDGATMVWVPEGTFIMGTEYGADWNAPHTQKVTLTGYWIYKYDVTVAQYRKFCTSTRHSFPEWTGDYLSWAGKNKWDDPALQQHPIIYTQWFDAKAYADWAGVSLPTEAQWEYAARGPQGNNYPWGGVATALDPYNGWDQTKCANYYNSSDVGKSTWPVGSFPAGASWCGAQDMSGNIWQWCSDWVGDYSATPVINPTGPVWNGNWTWNSESKLAPGICRTGPGTGDWIRVLRGGSWYDREGNNRSAIRNSNVPVRWDIDVGFRCASVSPGP